jgi:transposase
MNTKNDDKYRGTSNEIYDEEAELKLLAVQEVKNGKSVKKISNQMHVAESTIYKWLSIYKRVGDNGFDRQSGAPAKISEKRISILKSKILIESPHKFNLNGSFWTGTLLAKYVKYYFNIDISVRTGERVLKKCEYNKEEFINTKIGDNTKNSWELLFLKIWASSNYRQSEFNVVKDNETLVLKQIKPSYRELYILVAYNSYDKKFFLREVENFTNNSIINFISAIRKIHPKERLAIILKDTAKNKELFSRLCNNAAIFRFSDIFLSKSNHKKPLGDLEIDIKDIVSFYKDNHDRKVKYKMRYILNNYKSDLRISSDLIDLCRNKIGKGIRYLTKDSNTYCSEWSLVIPDDLFEMKNREVFHLFNWGTATIRVKNSHKTVSPIIGAIKQKRTTNLWLL